MRKELYTQINILRTTEQPLYDAEKERIMEHLKKEIRPTKRRIRSAILIGAVLTMLIAVSIPVLAITGVGMEWIYNIIPEEQAEKFTPVQLADEDQGIRVEVNAIHVEDTMTQVYFTMTDLLEHKNGIINESIKLLDDSWQLLPDSPGTICEPISEYDPETQTAHFLLTIENSVLESSPELLQTDQFTFTINSFVTGYGRISVNLPSIDLTAIETEPETEIMESGNASGCCIDTIILEDSAEFKQDKCYYNFLKPYNQPIPLSEAIPGYYLSGLAYRDGNLHIQIKDSSKMLGSKLPTLYIVKPDGTTMNLSKKWGVREDYSGSITTYSRGERNYEYHEFVFEVSLNELDGCTIGGNFPVSERVVHGDWEVTFPMEPMN